MYHLEIKPAHTSRDQLSLNEHLYKTDTFLRWTLRDTPFPILCGHLISLKGAVSRNSAKLGNYKTMPVKLRET